MITPVLGVIQYGPQSPPPLSNSSGSTFASTKVSRLTLPAGDSDAIPSKVINTASSRTPLGVNIATPVKVMFPCSSRRPDEVSVAMPTSEIWPTIDIVIAGVRTATPMMDVVPA